MSKTGYMECKKKASTLEQKNMNGFKKFQCDLNVCK